MVIISYWNGGNYKLIYPKAVVGNCCSQGVVGITEGMRLNLVIPIYPSLLIKPARTARKEGEILRKLDLSARGSAPRIADQLMWPSVG